MGLFLNNEDAAGARRTTRPGSVGQVLLAAFLLVVAIPFCAAKPSEAERKATEDWARNIDKATVHKAVLDHERDPLGKDSKKRLRPVLVVHFEPLDYHVCLDQIGSLLHDKDDVHDALFWQVVFGSGDFVEQHPDQAKDKFAYMVAGLESGLRAYENVMREKPKTRIELFDKLLALRESVHLIDFVKEHPCDKD